MSSTSSIKNAFLSFNFPTITGLVMAGYVYSKQSDVSPLASYLFGGKIYLITCLAVLGFHLLWWIIVDKATFYEFTHLIGKIFRDFVVANIVMLCTIGVLFFMNVFL